MFVRRALAGWLVALALTAAWFANIALWIRGDVLDARTFSEETSDLLDDQTLRSVLVDRLSEELVEAAPQLATVLPQVEQAVDSVVASPEFSAALASTIASVHRALFSGTGEAVTLDLSQVEQPIRVAVDGVAPGASASIPPGVYQDVTLVSAGDVPSVADQTDWVRDVAPLVAALALVLAGAAVALSPRRPGTLRLLGIGLVAMAALSWGTVWLLRNVALRAIDDGDARHAADTVAGVATDAFVRRCVLLGALGLAVMAAGFVLSGLLASLRAGGGGGRGGGGRYAPAPVPPPPMPAWPPAGGPPTVRQPGWSAPPAPTGGYVDRRREGGNYL